MDADHPRWAKIADVLVRHSVPEMYNAIDNESKANMFLQRWNTSTREGTTRLPLGLRNMLKAAKKYRVTFEPVLLDQGLKRELPIWHHIGTTKDKGNTPNNDAWSICQRVNHKILTVGEMFDFIHGERPQRHSERRNCACTVCRNLRREGCENPVKCR